MPWFNRNPRCGRFHTSVVTPTSRGHFKTNRACASFRPVTDFHRHGWPAGPCETVAQSGNEEVACASGTVANVSRTGQVRDPEGLQPVHRPAACCCHRCALACSGPAPLRLYRYQNQYQILDLSSNADPIATARVIALMSRPNSTTPSAAKHQRMMNARNICTWRSLNVR